MMKRLALMLLFLGCAGAAFGQGEVSLSVGAAKMRNNSLGQITASDGSLVDFKADSNFRLGFRFTINNWKFFGNEIGYAYNHGKLSAGGQDQGMPIHQGMYNFLAYATPEGSKIRPFATGGVHFSTFYPPGASVFSGNGTTKFGFNYGGGVKVRVSSAFGIRLDVRDYTNGKPFGIPGSSGLLHMLEVSGGVGMYF
jgi:opacity protein-like surface antigen